MKITREVKTGILVLTALLLVIFGYNYLKGQNLLDNNRTFYAVYDNVEGLIPASNVTINGLTVGKVVDIDFKDQTGKLLVTFEVTKNFQFSKNSIARVYGGGIIGGKSLAVIPKYEKGNAAVSGDTLASDIEEGIMEVVNKQLAPLQKQIENLLNDTDSVMASVNNVLDRKTTTNLRTAISDFTAVSRELKTATQSVNKLLATNEQAIGTTLTNAEKASEKIAQVSDNLAAINLETLAQEMQQTLASFKRIADDLENGNGTAGKLLKDDELYVNLERATQQMELLMQDLRLNPKRYVSFSVFGKKQKPYEPVEDTLR